jgi:hypothetical protein
MSATAEAVDYAHFVPGLIANLVAIGVLAYGIYYRRHDRRDLLTAYVCFNVGLFVVVTAMVAGGSAVGLGLGLGLFGALSIIRLRSEELSYVEVAYFFAALALAIVNGIQPGGLGFTIVLDAVVLAVMLGMDRLEPHRAVRRLTLVLDEIHTDDTALRAELERRLGFEVVAVSIESIDYVRELMTVDARYVERPVRDAQTDERRLLEVRA